MLVANQLILNPTYFGAKYDGETDDSQAHEDMFKYLTTLPSGNKQNCIIQLPTGVSYNSRAFHISHACIVQGAGGGSGDFAGTSLLFKYGVHGVIIDNWQTSKDGSGAQYCVLKDVLITAKGQEQSPPILHKNGLTLRNRAHVENVIVDGFSGDGFHIAAAGDSNIEDANALWQPNHNYTDGDCVRSRGKNIPIPGNRAKFSFETSPGNVNVRIMGDINLLLNHARPTNGFFEIPPGSSIAANWLNNNPAKECYANTDGGHIVKLTPLTSSSGNPLPIPAFYIGEYLKINSVACRVELITKNGTLLHLSKGIPTGSNVKVFAASNANIGLYMINSITGTSSIEATKISNELDFADSSAVFNPVDVHNVAINLNDLRVSSFAYERLCCIQGGLSASNVGSYPYPALGTSGKFADHEVIWKESLIIDKNNKFTSLGNANNWYLEYCRSAGNGRHGFFVQGYDANAGCAIQCDASDNFGWGFVDYSFLGNTYLACHAAGNLLGPYKTAIYSPNHSTFIGCYSEEGGSSSQIYVPSTTVGGIHGAGILGGSGTFIGSNITGEIAFSDGVKTAITIGGTSGDHFMSLYHPAEKNSPPFYVEMQTGINGVQNSDTINIRYSNFAISTRATYNRNSGRHPGKAKLLQNELYLGSRLNYIGFNRDRNLTDPYNPEGLYAPGNGVDTLSSLGVFEIGDRIYNYDPKPGGYEGWIVTEGGTTGNQDELESLAKGTVIPTADGTKKVLLNMPIPNMSIPGRYLKINGIKARVNEIVNNTPSSGINEYYLVMSEIIPLPVAPARPGIEYAPPVFTLFGSISTININPIIPTATNFTFRSHIDIAGNAFQTFGFVKVRAGDVGVQFSIHKPNNFSGFAFNVLCTVQTFGSELTSVIANTKEDPVNFSNIIVTIIGNKKATVDTEISCAILWP